ncbi:MAG: pyridoxamine 5'-phosphate oxidase family protein [Ilumatobacteraceae bacterium]
MSIPVALTELAEAAASRAYAYLLTVNDDGRPHAVAVSPEFSGDSMVIAEAGRRTSANASARPSVSLVYPPADLGGYSLIVDALASVDGTTVSLRPSGAVLHRPAPGHEPGPGSCGSDCVPISLTASE